MAPKAEDKEPDPLTVDALVQRYPVPGATNADRRAAALLLLGKGWTTEDIGTVLRVSPDTVNKWAERKRKAGKR